MSGFYGADTDQLREHGQRVAQQAQRLLELRDQLTPRIMDAGIWRGPDADAFRDRWSGEISGRLEQGSEDMHRRGTDLEQEAEEQDTVSEEGGEGGSGSGGGDKPFDPFGFLKDMLKKGQGLYKKISSMIDFIKRIPNAADEFAQLAERGLEKLWRAAYLDELFKGGKGWQSAAEKLLDKLGLPTSIGKFEPLKLLNKLDDVAPWLKTAGKGLGKVLPFVDVGLGLQQAISADNWYDRTSGILGAAGGALLILAPFTGPLAPVVGAVGAGLGVVSAGMDIGKMVYENWPAISSGIGDAASAAGSAISSAASTAGEAIGNAGQAIGDAASSVGSAVSDGLGRVGRAFGF